MPVLLYILKLSVGLIIVWLFYQLVLRRLTFYTWNRWYLMVCSSLAFLLPLINISPVLEKNNWTKTPFVSAIPQIAGYENKQTAIVQQQTFSEQLLSWLPYIVVIGALAMMVRLIIQFFSLLAMRRSSKLLLNGPVKVYQVNKAVIPFSFGNAIYINQHLHEEEELKEIIRHEFIHVKQRHTIDIIWSEAICILTWYNPFSWLLRKAIRQNLEFIADQQVLKTGLDRREYQYLLLKVIGVPTFSIASNFNFKSLKKRIAMMNKVKSARLHLVRFLLLLPVVAIILVAFRNAAQQRQYPAIIVTNDTAGPSKKSFPENVRSFHIVNNQATVTLKNGKTETYNLDDDTELAAFEKKYGKIPEPPTPPTPPAQVFVEPSEPPQPDVVVAAPPPPPYPQAPPAPEEHYWYDLVHPDQDDYNEKGYSLTLVQTKQGPMVIVLHKSRRKAELVYYEDWRKDKKYEEKYGKVPSAPALAPHTPMPVPAPDAHHYPEEVASVHIKDYDAVVTKVDGKVERYNLRITEDKKAYESKYGPATHPAPAKVHGDVEVVSSAIEEILTAPAQARAGVVETPVESEREIVGVITSQMDFKDLEKLKSDLKAKGVTLELTDSKLKDSKLFAVEGSVHDGKKKAYFKAHEFDRVIISRGENRNGEQIYHINIVVKGTKN